MIITCPSCSARYPVDAAAFPPAGRKVRCAKCGETWHQDPPDDLPKKVDEIEEAIEAAVEAEPPPADSPEDAPAEREEAEEGVVARSARVTSVTSSGTPRTSRQRGHN